MKKVFVPTVTAIIFDPKDPRRIVVATPREKHGGKRVFPGGKRQIGQSELDAIIQEVREETGLSIDSGTVAEDSSFFCRSTKGNRDVRIVTVGKLAKDGYKLGDDLDEKVTAYFCDDTCFLIPATGDVAADLDEMSEVEWVDVYDLKPEDFAIDHGALMMAYRRYIETGKRPKHGDF